MSDSEPLRRARPLSATTRRRLAQTPRTEPAFSTRQCLVVVAAVVLMALSIFVFAP